MGNNANALQYVFDFDSQYPISQPVFECVSPKPFIKWVGGKSQLIGELVSHLPIDFDRSVTTYIEPFIGGGAFLFWMLSHSKHLQRIIINDANETLINAYKIVRDKASELVSILTELKKQYAILLYSIYDNYNE